MTIQDILKNIAERVQTTASVKAVYGDPITAEGKTIIPVARVRYGFGGGGGSQVSDPGAEDGDDPRQNMGGGGGGGVEVTPVGMIEITEGETRYVSFEEARRIIKAVVLLSVLGLLVWWRRRRS